MRNHKRGKRKLFKNLSISNNMFLATHIGFGILVYLALTTLTPLSIGFLSLAFFLGGLITPDLDHPKSKVGREFKLVSHILFKLFGHRGLIHSFLGAAIFVLLVALVIYTTKAPWILLLWYLFGFLSHLVADSLTPHGVMWLAPFSKRKVRFMIKSGSLRERFLEISIYILIFILITRLIL